MRKQGDVKRALRQPENKQETGSRKLLRSGCPPEVGRATQFKPGQTGNPGGRPTKRPISEAYERILTATEADKIALGLLKQAQKGNVKAAAEMADRVEGKVPQALSGLQSGTLAVQIITNVKIPDPYA